MVGFLLIFLYDYWLKRDFYNQLLETEGELEERGYLSEFLEEPSFQEGQMLYHILRHNEKYMNDCIALYQRDLQEYKDYVETWVHEIKTPIAVSKLIMENNRNDVTRSLSQEMDKLEGFVEQLLYYSKSNCLQDDYNIRPVSLKALTMTAVKKHAKYMIAEKVTPQFGTLDFMVLTDAKWLDFILGQIISNGVKYHAKEREPALVFSATQTGKTVTLTIADNGIGIPPEDVNRVFRKGFTGENGRNYPKSTGMGLYLCDTLCRKLGTQISLSSVVGEGTVVSLSLVAAEKDRANIAKL